MPGYDRDWETFNFLFYFIYHNFSFQLDRGVYYNPSINTVVETKYQSSLQIILPTASSLNTFLPHTIRPLTISENVLVSLTVSTLFIADAADTALI